MLIMSHYIGFCMLIKVMLAWFCSYIPIPNDTKSKSLDILCGVYLLILSLKKETWNIVAKLTSAFFMFYIIKSFYLVFRLNSQSFNTRKRFSIFSPVTAIFKSSDSEI